MFYRASFYANFVLLIIIQNNYENKNSLEFVAGRPTLTVDELAKKGDKGVEHRYRFSVIGYDENKKEHEAMKSKGEKKEEYRIDSVKYMQILIHTRNSATTTRNHIGTRYI